MEKNQDKNLPAVVQTAISTQNIDLNNVNLILPTQTFGQVIGEYDKITLEVVKIDPDPANGDVFEVANGKFSPGKRPLMAISNALSIIWDAKTTGIVEWTDKRCRAKATGAMRKPNGEWVIISDEKTLDLEVIEEEQTKLYTEKAEKGDQDNIIKWETSRSGKKYPIFAKWKSEAEKEHWITKSVRKAVLQYRKFMCERTLTGAKERVIRQIIAMKSTFTVAELNKPFAFPRITLDASKMLESPKARQAAIEKMSGSVQSIFGPTKEEVHPEYEVHNNSSPQIEAPEGEGPKPEDIPFDTTETKSPEEEEIEAALEVLQKLSETSYLHKDAKGLANDMLDEKEHNLDAINSLIERINDWLKKYQVAETERIQKLKEAAK